MRAALLLSMVLVVLTSCGVKRPVMRPQDIPAYQEKMRKKREQMIKDMGNDTSADDDNDTGDKPTTAKTNLPATTPSAGTAP